MTMVKAPNAVAFLLDEIVAMTLFRSRLLSSSLSGSDFADGRFTDAVRKLKGAGINLAIDHFGAGFAGLSLLAQYQPDRIKIDHELIRNIHRTDRASRLYRRLSNAVLLWRLRSQPSALSVLKSGCGWNQPVFHSSGNLFASARLGAYPPSHGRRKMNHREIS